MVMIESGIIIFGIDLFILLMLLSGVFYFVSAMIIWKPFREEKNELISALFAFLIYQSFGMFFMGIEMMTMNIWYGHISALAIFLGSAYMLKFPLSRLSEKVRNVAFLAVVLITLSIFGWFLTTPERQHMLMNFVLWYDIVINGIIVGGSIILFAFYTAEKIKRRKAIAGGAGVLSCCIVGNATMITGAFAVSSVFQFLAPLFIIFSIRSKGFSKALGIKGKETESPLSNNISGNQL